MHIFLKLFIAYGTGKKILKIKIHQQIPGLSRIEKCFPGLKYFSRIFQDFQDAWEPCIWHGYIILETWGLVFREDSRVWFSWAAQSVPSWSVWMLRQCPPEDQTGGKWLAIRHQNRGEGLLYCELYWKEGGYSSHRWNIFYPLPWVIFLVFHRYPTYPGQYREKPWSKNHCQGYAQQISLECLLYHIEVFHIWQLV